MGRSSNLRLVVTAVAVSAAGFASRPAAAAGTVATGSLKGVVTDAATKKAIAGALVEVLPPPPVGAPSGPPPQPITAKTGSDGSYKLDKLPAGKPNVRFGAPGYAPLTNAVTISANAAATANAALKAAPTGTISGVVTDAVTKKAISGATVEIVPPPPANGAGAGAPPPPIKASTDADGKYTAKLVPTGNLDVHLGAKGYQPALVKVTVAANASVTASAALKPVPTGSVVGTVANSAGSPIAGAGIDLVPVPPADGQGCGGTPPPPLHVTVGSDGVFSFAKVPVGDWMANVGAQGYAKQSLPVTVTEGKTTTLKVVLAKG